MQQLEEQVNNYLEDLEEQVEYLQERRQKSEEDEKPISRSTAREFVLSEVRPTVSQVDDLLSRQELNGSYDELKQEYVDLRTSLFSELYGSEDHDGLVDEHDLPRDAVTYSGSAREKYARAALGREQPLT